MRSAKVLYVPGCVQAWSISLTSTLSSYGLCWLSGMVKCCDLLQDPETVILVSVLSLKEILFLSPFNVIRHLFFIAGSRVLQFAASKVLYSTKNEKSSVHHCICMQFILGFFTQKNMDGKSVNVAEKLHQCHKFVCHDLYMLSRYENKKTVSFLHCHCEMCSCCW